MSRIKSYIISLIVALFILGIIAIDINAVVSVFDRLDNLERNCPHD
jgi:FtsH-binding integral membrane protein